MKAAGNIEMLEPVSVSLISDDTGSIVVAQQGAEYPFAVQRVFVVQGVSADTVRGNHALASCTELLICL
ncbi:MAG: WxcM-like domain-containing protein, partial [Alphaproteobacteria bacterium]